MHQIAKRSWRRVSWNFNWWGVFLSKSRKVRSCSSNHRPISSDQQPCLFCTDAMVCFRISKVILSKYQNGPVFVVLTYSFSVLSFSYMYWTDWGEEPRIERAGMDASNRYCNYITHKQTQLLYLQSYLYSTVSPASTEVVSSSNSTIMTKQKHQL